jgi:hypothetical protein
MLLTRFLIITTVAILLLSCESTNNTKNNFVDLNRGNSIGGNIPSKKNGMLGTPVESPTNIAMQLF